MDLNFYATFFLGVLVVFYLSSFVLFAIVRIITGVSIQRLGYFSFRRITYAKNGFRVDIRRVGFSLHRPTFSQPTWISIVIRDALVTYDPYLSALKAASAKAKTSSKSPDERPHANKSSVNKIRKGDPSNAPDGSATADRGRRSTVEIISKGRRLLENIHRFINWIKLVDVVFHGTSFAVTGVGKLQFGTISLNVDTRRRDNRERSRSTFSNFVDPTDEQRPAEWTLSCRTGLFTVEGRESVQVVDYLNLSIYGILEKRETILKDVAFLFKLGRIVVPLDDIDHASAKYSALKNSIAPKHSKRFSLPAVMMDMSLPGSRTERLVEIVTESKDLLTSIVASVQEVSLAVASLEVTKSSTLVRPAGKPLLLTLLLKDMGLDLHRLDQESPAHRMDFSPDEVAHQALLAAISMSCTIDDGNAHVDKILYVPMITITSKTTLPSKTIQLAERIEADRNTNILNANMVVTSPSIDLEPRHLPMAMAFLSRRTATSTLSGGRRQLISRLLPRVSIKFSVHEPVVRVLLPPHLAPKSTEVKHMDMLISTVSSLSMDIESSHQSENQHHYLLSSNFRITSQSLFYRASSGERNDLFQLEKVDFRLQLDASPEVRLAGDCTLESFSLRLVRPEIVQGIKEMVSQFGNDVKPDKLHVETGTRAKNMLRELPLWLMHFKLEGRDFLIEIAGVDESISNITRGVALQLERCVVEYKCQHNEPVRQRHPRRRASRALTPDDRPPPPVSAKISKNPTDGRRLSFHIHGFDGFMVDSMDLWDPEPICTIPHFETVVSTSTEHDGASMSINSRTRAFFVNYSLFKHYALLVAAKVVKEALGFGAGNGSGGEEDGGTSRPAAGLDKSPLLSPAPMYGGMDLLESPSDKPEFISVDFGLKHVKIKATLPGEPRMMFELYHFETGRLRYGFPFAKTRNLRVYVESALAKGSWARIISAKHLRADLREQRHKSGNKVVPHKSIDLSMDSIRLAVPHKLTLYKVTDNIVNTVKASQQLYHRYKTGTDSYILEKKPEGPKSIPSLSIRAKALQLELEDDPFESKLAMNYRLGLSEQKNRLAREEAFRAKVAKIEEARGKRNSVSAQTDETDDLARRRSEESSRVPDTSGARQKMRYDADNAKGVTANAAIPVEVAWRKLQEHNSQAWIKRVKWSSAQAMKRIEEMRRKAMGDDDVPPDVDASESVLSIPMRPALAMFHITDLDLVLDKPSFPLSELPKFLNRVGKGLPEDTKFALLVPMNVSMQMGEFKIQLRDYPLPLIHIPQMRPSQVSKSASWTLKTDFVLAEEFRDEKSMRHVKVDVVPATEYEGKSQPAFGIDVRRTVSPVKSYSDIDITISTSYATRITWGTSLQPAIQDMMMRFETFTKPHIDPSEKIGFWDKIRLGVHSQIRIAWNGDGDIHLMLKGSRDPYVVTGNGAGFVMCWRGNVRWHVANDPDPLQFMVIGSDEYLLAVPDFSHQALAALEEARQDSDTASMSSGSSTFKKGAVFKKVIMKLSGKVKWQIGLVFEQEIGNLEQHWTKRTRSFNFKPHYDITLRHPMHAVGENGEVYDAFRGFRSHHLHLSMSIIAPLDHDWSHSKPSGCYNAIHLTPRFFTHFYDWWELFSGVMSLPIRQGPLWPGVEKSTKKFGRHIATIKYKLLLSPLFISHIYKHKDAEDLVGDGKLDSSTVTATGLKIRLDSFLLDMHQRREESVIKVKGFNTDRTSMNMSINQAELDFHSADVRAVSAIIPGTTVEDMKDWAGGEAPVQDSSTSVGDTSRFTIPDGDLSWIDMDDFVELDWILPMRSSPETQIMPLAFAPRFTYFRQTDRSSESKMTGRARSSPFGSEPTHECVMSHNNGKATVCDILGRFQISRLSIMCALCPDPREIQCGLIQTRLEKVNSQMMKNKEALQHLADRIKDDPENQKLKSQSEKLISQSSVLHNKIFFLQSMLKSMSQKLDGSGIVDDSADDMSDDDEPIILDSVPFADFVNDFNNRFIVHNMQAKWNNSLRNIILRYIHQVSQRRGFVYYMSRRAIKFILDLLDEQADKSKSSSEEFTRDRHDSQGGSCASPVETEEDNSVNARIQALLDDVNKVVVADDTRPRTRRMSVAAAQIHRGDLMKGISDEYVAWNSYHIRLIAPQIQMQSEKNPVSALLVTSQGMQLKVVSVMDKERLEDAVSGLVQRRFALDVENAQTFISRQKDFVSQLHWLHSANRYGSQGSSSWPPWVPLENMFDFQSNPHGFSRVVEKTSTTFRFDKHNSLRLKLIDTGLDQGGAESASGAIESEARVDQIWADFQRVNVSCNSDEYFSLYIIVLDLLLYTEPLEKRRNERLEKILLASDFSDLSGAPAAVYSLQQRIQQLEEIKTHFQINAKNLDSRGWEDRLSLEQDLATCEDELFFLMKAIMSVQRKYDERQQTTGMVRWYLSASEIVAHLLRGKDEPFIDLKLENSCYERTDNSDGSNFNTLEIEMLNGLNRLSEAVYPTMIAPYTKSTVDMTKVHQAKILRVSWNMLEAIAGIPVMDHFEVNLFPLKIQLDRDTGQKLFEYIFPGMDSNAFETGGFSPFMVQTSIKSLPAEDSVGSESETESLFASYDSFTSTDDGYGGSSRDVNTPLETRLVPTRTTETRRVTTSSSSEKSRPKTSHSEWQFKSLKPKSHLRRQKSAESLPQSSKQNTLDVPGRSAFERPGTPLKRTVNSSSSASIHESIKSTTTESTRKLQIFNRSSTPRPEADKKRDDISQMISRASNYMTLAYVKVPSVILCLSYKGKGERNIEDIHEFVFRMPTLEYRNKMWSNLDLALRLKKDIIKALISHTGALLENKILHHRPSTNKNAHLRQLAIGSLQSTAIGVGQSDSDASSSIGTPEILYSGTSTPRGLNSRLPSRGGDSHRSRSSSVHSSASHSSNQTSITRGVDARSFTSVGQSEDEVVEGDSNPGQFLNVLGRHGSRLRETPPAETEESIKKKSRLLLGKKLLGSS